MPVNERSYTEFQTMSLMECGLKKYFVCLRKCNTTSTGSTVARSGILLLIGKVNSDSPWWAMFKSLCKICTKCSI